MGVNKSSWLHKAWCKLCLCQRADHDSETLRAVDSNDTESKQERIDVKTVSTTTSISAATLTVQTKDVLNNRQLQLQEGHAKFELVNTHIPELQRAEEVLVAVKVIGLNPIDWKSVAYGFGIPSWPFVSGREFVGKVVKRSEYSRQSDPRVGDLVLVVSTDYRDYRKAAFQNLAVALEYNTLRIPPNIPIERLAGVGVAFIAAAFSLGICLGAVFPSTDCVTGLDLLLLARSQPKHSIPEDVRNEVFGEIKPEERIREGDWLLVYGASSISGQMIVQLAKLAGIRVIAIADAHRHSERLVALGTNLVIDRSNLEIAAQRVNETTDKSLGYAIDTVDKKTAEWTHELLRTTSTKRDSSTETEKKTHLVGLSGVPKEIASSVQAHTLPIKLFHTNAVLGRAVMLWLQELLSSGKLKLPEVDVISGGLEGVNEGLERLKRGEASGKRIVVTMSEDI